jgi:MOSC domain-containing protein YiiM
MTQETKTSPINLRTEFRKSGRVHWLGIRPAREVKLNVVNDVHATIEKGLVGDRFSGKPGADRQVTLIQFEHLGVVASLLGQDEIDPGLMRRNIVVSGINLTALKGTEFAIGDAIFRGTGACAPCGRMERNLGPGGFSAMRGHGGITATVIQNGTISIGDEVRFLALAPTQSANEENVD